MHSLTPWESTPDITQHTSELSELDLAILHALQIAPRASWTRLGAVLGVHHTTVARHWARLRDAGLGWLVGYYPGQHDLCAAEVQLRCPPGRAHRLATELSDDPYAVSIDLLHGEVDLHVQASAPDLPRLSAYISDRLAALPGVSELRSRVVTTAFDLGQHWQLDALTGHQREQLAAPATVFGHPEPAGQPAEDGAPFGPREWAILAVLGPNPRCSWEELAARTDLTIATARRRVQRMIRTGTIQFRCEVAGAATGWPVQVNYGCVCPAERLTDAAARICAMPHTRRCVAVAGSSNLQVTAWLRNLADSTRLEVLLGRAGARVTERSVVLRSIKRMGRLLDQHGRRRAYVPMNIWTNVPDWAHGAA
jgi:DNA-binding Lrp family transcriptional regulator